MNWNDITTLLRGPAFAGRSALARLLLVIVPAAFSVIGCTAARSIADAPPPSEAPTGMNLPRERRLPAPFVPDAQRDPRVAEAFERKAADAHARGMLNEAFDLYERALMADPERPDLYHRFAAVAESLGNLTRAISAYEALLELDGESAWSVLANSRLDVLRARASLERIRAAKRSAAAGDYASAVRILSDAVVLKPDPGTLRVIRSLYYPYCCLWVAGALRARGGDAELVGVITNGAPAYQREALRVELQAALDVVVPDGVRYAPLPRRALDRIAQSREGDAIPDAVASDMGARWGLAAELGEGLRFATIDAREKRVTNVSSFDTPGPFPPQHRSDIWLELPGETLADEGIHLRVWSETERVGSGGTIPVRVQLDRAAYAYAFLIASDGSVTRLAVRGQEGERLLAPNRAHTVTAPVGEAGRVSGVFVLVSRTSLFDALTRAPLIGEDALDHALREVDTAPEDTWAAGRWTWFVGDAAPEETVDRDVRILPLPGDEVELP